jgi:formylglycine-generating enzyme
VSAMERRAACEPKQTAKQVVDRWRRRRGLCSSMAAAMIAYGTVTSWAGTRSHVVRIERSRPEAVEVPAGRFSMGLDPDAIQSLQQHCTTMTTTAAGVKLLGGAPCEAMATQLEGMAMRAVFVSRFAIGRKEVTAAEYRVCVAAGICSLDPLVGGDERYIRDAWPVVNVTWWEASEYCRWRGGRLPTEAEWERAARGDDTRTWPWGDLERLADFNHGQMTSLMTRGLGLRVEDLLGDPDDSDGALILSAPGSYPWGQGPYGTLDQAGNVAEWVYDAWSITGYENLSSTNPVREPTLFDPRVVRGGSWRQTPQAARVDTRDLFNEEYLPNLRSPYVGFRCAWDRH